VCECRKVVEEVIRMEAPLMAAEPPPLGTVDLPQEEGGVVQEMEEATMTLTPTEKEAATTMKGHRCTQSTQREAEPDWTVLKIGILPRTGLGSYRYEDASTRPWRTFKMTLELRQMVLV
jgi:hypothetical protein